MHIKVKTHRLVAVCIALIAISFLVQSLKAQESDGGAGVFLRMGVGARPLGMGGAFVGMANGPATTYWNPAGLGRIHNFQFEFMNVALPFDRTFNFFSGVLPIRRIMTVGVSWIGLRVNDIEGRSSNTSTPDYVFGSSQNAFLISLGKSITPFLSVGGNIKIIRNELESLTATGLGFDASLLLRPSYRLKLGLLVQDIGTDYRWNNNLTEGVPMNFRIGASYEIYNDVVLVADMGKTVDLKPKFHVGSEIRPVESLPLRIGWNDGQISGGAGFILPISNNSLELDYAYSNDRLFNDDIHRLSVVFTLGHGSPRVKGEDSKNVPFEKWTDRPARSRKKTAEIVVTARILNVRSGPGTNHRKISKIYRGQKFEALETKGNWRKIKLRGRTMGWVHRNYIRVVD
ncbi:SH3 domain-containing protein [candidate division KSB1 bacterium]|nr:SH3 domain-containing protein [candidate division KSB1 bacterium]NIR72524.1 SH3 domain-containing protein [candidate division KSB1 bacterium]NIS23823.1 SH3 domain-containing protein [candidate division KSB1 bacterium]NIT70750.1 SH3 domain-containing protein [candidate division KSB1 bacterium]NIU24265.1 SH3 domain-containing protein [candidate division KSB1 bacterium]